MICVPVMAETNREAMGRMKKGFALAEAVELRIDRIHRPDLALLVGTREGALLVTNRRKKEGGFFEGSEKDRVDLLVEAAKRGADFVAVVHGHVELLVVGRNNHSGGRIVTRRLLGPRQIRGVNQVAILAVNEAQILPAGPAAHVAYGPVVASPAHARGGHSGQHGKLDETSPLHRQEPFFASRVVASSKPTRGTGTRTASGRRFRGDRLCGS